MKVIVSAAISLDGYLDDCLPERLRLSSREDWAAVHLLRAQCDAILVGAGTIRADNPSLQIDDQTLREWRMEQGMSPDITKVTISGSGNIDTSCRFLTHGDGPKIVFTQGETQGDNWDRIKTHADVVVLTKISAREIVKQLEKSGCRTLLVEGGSKVLTMFFEQGMVDQFRLAIAPFFVGDPRAPRLVGQGAFPYNKGRKMSLSQVEMLGDTAVMHYVLDKQNDE